MLTSTAVLKSFSFNQNNAIVFDQNKPKQLYLNIATTKPGTKQKFPQVLALKLNFGRPPMIR